MTDIRKNYSSEFKARVAFDALKGDKTISELSSHYGVHGTQIIRWKKYLKEYMAKIFTDSGGSDKAKDNLIEELYKQNGKLNYELAWLKKKISLFDN